MVNPIEAIEFQIEIQRNQFRCDRSIINSLQSIDKINKPKSYPR